MPNFPSPSCLALFLALCWAAFAGAQDESDPCAVCDDVHFFLARGNNEAYPGRQGMLVEATCNGLASCGYEDLHYSALYIDLSCQTTYDGTVAGHVQMTAYAEKCPNSKIIVAGYSQGGQIAGYILGGGGGLSFNGCEQPETPALDPESSPGNRIAAIIIFGDTRHVADQSYNWGSGSSIDGYFPRSETQVANLQPYADRMRNWCVDTDPICAAQQPTSHNATDHLSYFNVDSQSAASWIKSVASLTNTDNSFTTAIPISLSGSAQDYATVGTATPSGSVTLDTTWTDSTSYAACTAASYSQRAAASTAEANTSISSSATSDATQNASSSTSPSMTSVFPTTEPSSQATEASSSSDASSSDSETGGATNFLANAGGLLSLLAFGAFFGMVLL